METVLSARLKNVVCAVLAVLFALGAFASRVLLPRAWPAAKIEALLARNSAGIEALVRGEIKENLQRSQRLFERFKAGRLNAAMLEKKEALISAGNGVIDSYQGEIYFFKALSLAPGEWRLIKKNHEIYFLRLMDERVHYLCFFMDMRSDPIRRAWKYPYALFDLKYSPRPLTESPGGLAYDQARKSFHYSHVLKAGQSQLIVNLIFSEADFSRHFKKRHSLLFYAAVFLFFLVLLVPLSGRPWLRAASLAAMALSAWFLIAWLGKHDIHFQRPLPALQSVWQLTTALLFFVLAWMGFGRRRRNNFLAFALFNLLAGIVLYAIPLILRSVDFPFDHFFLNPDYLGLLLLLIGLHALPLMVAVPYLRSVSWQRNRPLLLAQAALLLINALGLKYAVFSFTLLGLLFIVFLVCRRRFWPRALLAALLTISIGQWLVHSSQLEKQEFIRSNLVNIFSGQNQYAKLVAREIVYEINSRQAQLFSLFREDSRDELARIWQNTLAARESIASGLYVVSRDQSLIHSFSFGIPRIDISKKDIFPFWHVETVDADLFGKKVNLALATINVFEKERYLGYIMVQVLNAAELILHSQGQRSVFDLDRKITAAGMGYLKLDATGGVLENPDNINVENLAALAGTSGWHDFRNMGIVYRGYVFRSSDETVIIFYPRNTVFKTFSELIKILCVLLLAMAVFFGGTLRKMRGRFLFRSFSLKVFAILVLLSMLTAAVFSMFSLNFNFLSQETQLQRAVYARGRSALNIVNNLLAEGGEITQTHLFLLEKILENDISVYENGVLLYTSNHGKIIRSQLPIYLDSGIRQTLNRSNQQFYLQKKEDFLALNFRASGDYIFVIEFSYDSADLLRSRQYYLDFLVSIFFILIVIGVAAAFFFRNKIVAPIHRLNRGMAEVRQGRLQPLQDMPAETELRELVLGFNAMLEGIKEQKKNISEIARMKTLVELGRRVAHEVKNPLTPIKLSAEQILRSLQDPGREARPLITNAVRYIIEETEHLRRVAYGFLNLSKLDELKPAPFQLNGLVAEAVGQLRSIYPQVCFRVEENAPSIDVVADRQKIKQVLDNVLTNALEAVAGRDGRIEVALARRESDVEVRIRDNGPGISGEELQRIASAEFSSKDLGTGLGLVIARRFLELHHGGLDISSVPGQGTLVIVRFASHVHPS